MGNIITKYLTKNPYYNDGRWITGDNFKGFTLHSVGVGQPDPMVFWNNWNKSSYTNAGINGFIGSDNIYITAPCLETSGKVKRMPHAGKQYGNNCYIGFEMCEPSQVHYTGVGANFTCSDYAAARAFVTKTYNNAVQLFAELCKLHKKDPLTPGVIYSHNEMGKLGIGSGHVDPEHLWKGLGMSYTMDGFRQDVYKKMKSGFTILEPIGGKPNTPHEPLIPIEEDEDMTQEKFNEMMANYRKTLQDNDSHSYSKEAREWCMNNGIIQGTGTTINGEPNGAWEDFLTREQVATLFYRFAKMMGQV